MSKISILLPTRGRRDVMKTSVEGLLHKAKVPGRIELLLGIDNDDEGIQEFIKDELGPICNELGVDCKAQVFPPLGYGKLHHYVNTLAAHATGDCSSGTTMASW